MTEARWFYRTIRNAETGEVRRNLIASGRVPDIAPYQEKAGWSVVWPVEELSGPPPPNDEQLRTLGQVFSDIESRRHGYRVMVTMKRKGRRRKPRVIALHEGPEPRDR